MCRVQVLTLYVLLVSLSVVTLGQCKTIKRNQKDLIRAVTDNDLPLEGGIREKAPTKVPPAILAIEIVDPDDNSTSKSKTSKRTINSNLGYGAPGNYHYGVSNKPQLVYYKYSQHIPPYQDNSYYPSAKAPQINVQKSVEYDLGTQVQYYQPGTTLFTTYDQNGQFGQLTNQVPTTHNNGHNGQNVPVVYLKIYSNQLANNGLYANLPQNHPYSGLNTVNLQELLARYFQPTNQQNYQQGEDYYSNQPEVYQQNYQDQIGGYQYQSYQQPGDHVAQSEEAQEDGLPTHENYPDDAHTRVIFHQNHGHYPQKSYSKANIPPPQSYSSIEFKPSQPDYSSSKTTQEQDQDGYYYYKPQSNQVYVQNVAQEYQQQYSLPEDSSHQIEGHSTSAPYNYHAHPLRGKKRNVRRPENLRKTITELRQED